MTIEADIAAARALAHDVGHVVNEVQAIYFIGSRAKGTGSDESDFDFVAFVTGSLRSKSPNWGEKGSAPAPGFASTCNGAPAQWLLLSVDDFDRHDFEGNADYSASPALLVYERDRAVLSPVPPSTRENAD
jgi:hypothetical protein